MRQWQVQEAAWFFSLHYFLELFARTLSANPGFVNTTNRLNARGHSVISHSPGWP